MLLSSCLYIFIPSLILSSCLYISSYLSLILSVRQIFLSACFWCRLVSGLSFILSSCLYTLLPVFISVYLSIYLHTCLWYCPAVYIPCYLSYFLSICLYIFSPVFDMVCSTDPLVCVFLVLCSCLKIFWLSFDLSNFRYIFLYVFDAVYMDIYLPNCLYCLSYIFSCLPFYFSTSFSVYFTVRLYPTDSCGLFSLYLSLSHVYPDKRI